MSIPTIELNDGHSIPEPGFDLQRDRHPGAQPER
jgi:hypothetical protein